MKARITHKLLDWERRAILDAYLAGEKIEAIGAEFGVDRAYPRALARREGHPVRPSGRPRSKREQLPDSMLVA